MYKLKKCTDVVEIVQRWGNHITEEVEIIVAEVEGGGKEEVSD